MTIQVPSAFCIHCDRAMTVTLDLAEMAEILLRDLESTARLQGPPAEESDQKTHAGVSPFPHP